MKELPMKAICEPNIRIANDNDLDNWVKMRKRLWPDSSYDELKEVQHLFQAQKFAVFFAEYGNDQVGFVEVALRPYVNGCDTSPVAFVEGIWVHENFQKLGIGRSLIKAAEEWAISLAVKELASDTRIESIDSIYAHNSWGFKETERVVYFKKTLDRADRVKMENLAGGRDAITRIGNKVHRPAGPWSQQVQQLLQHIRRKGFDKAPEPFGFDDQGREIVSYLQGDVPNYPLSLDVTSPEALTTSAKLLRDYHDATEDFLATVVHQPELWQLPPRSPWEVICHGDFAPYNIVFRGSQAVGIIDFDTAHPGPRSWDIAYALYRWSPFTSPNNKDGFGNITDQIRRATMFCDAYGFSDRKILVPLMIERLQALVAFMIGEASKENPTHKTNIQDGHHLLYRSDIEYIEKYRAEIENGL